MLWMDFPGVWGENYELSGTGIVRNKKNMRLLKTYDHQTKKILMVTLNRTDDQGHKMRRTINISRAVYEVFARPLLWEECLGYKDGNYKNVSLTNLELRKTIQARKRRQLVSLDDIVSEAVKLAAKGICMEDAAKSIGIDQVHLERVLGVVFYKRVCLSAGKQPEPDWLMARRSASGIHVRKGCR